MGKISPIKIENFQLNDFCHDYRLRALLKLVPTEYENVLDIGSGNGEMAIFLARKARFVLAIDKSELLIERLREKAKGNPHLKVLRIDAEGFSLKEKKFSLITACDVAEHIKDDFNLFRNCFLHLKKNGRLFVSVPAGQFLYGARDRNCGHFRRYQKKDLENNIKKSGFTILSSRYWNLIGFLPYLISEKVFKKELVGPVRKEYQGFFPRILNQFLYTLLTIEGKIKVLPFGLTLIVLAQKKDET